MAMQPAKAADAARVARTPRTVLLTLSSFDRRPIEARTEVLTIRAAPLGEDFLPSPSPCQCNGPCALTISERMNEDVSCGQCRDCRACWTRSAREHNRRTGSRTLAAATIGAIHEHHTMLRGR